MLELREKSAEGRAQAEKLQEKLLDEKELERQKQEQEEAEAETERRRQRRRKHRL